MGDGREELLVSLAESAGNKILEVYGTSFSVDVKQDNSPLTQADLASHKTIIEGLAHTGIPVLSEESEDASYETRQAWSEFWLVDPLDGTKEFIKRNGEFTVNIALVREGRPVIGVVHVPVQNVTYYADEVAVKYENGKRTKLKTAPFNVNLRVVASRSHASAALQDFLSKLPNHQIVPCGSSLKFCRIAEGAADVYPRFGPTMEWDTAAAHAIVEAAGGSVVDLTGKHLRYNKQDLHNPYFLVIGDATQTQNILAEVPKSQN